MVLSYVIDLNKNSNLPPGKDVDILLNNLPPPLTSSGFVGKAAIFGAKKLVAAYKPIVNEVD